MGHNTEHILSAFKFVYWPSTFAKRLSTTDLVYPQWGITKDDFFENILKTSNVGFNVIITTATNKLKFSKIWIYGQKGQKYGTYGDPYGSVNIKIGVETTTVSESSTKYEPNALIYESTSKNSATDSAFSIAHEDYSISNNVVFISCVYYLLELEPTITSTPTFTPSKHFTESTGFSQTKQFTTSFGFSSSFNFLNTNDFTKSSKFTTSFHFSKSFDFTPSSHFMPSSNFLATVGFIQSGRFTASFWFSISPFFTSDLPMKFSNSFDQIKTEIEDPTSEIKEPASLEIQTESFEKSLVASVEAGSLLISKSEAETYELSADTKEETDSLSQIKETESKSLSACTQHESEPFASKESETYAYEPTFSETKHDASTLTSGDETKPSSMEQESYSFTKKESKTTLFKSTFPDIKTETISLSSEVVTSSLTKRESRKESLELKYSETSIYTETKNELTDTMSIEIKDIQTYHSFRGISSQFVDAETYIRPKMQKYNILLIIGIVIGVILLIILLILICIYFQMIKKA